MFQSAAVVTVPFPEKLSEQYELDGSTITANLSFEKLSDFVHSFYAELDGSTITANLSFEKLSDFVHSFYAELDEPLFLAIHPDAESDEVWYLDGMTKKQLTMILDGYGELLYQDGLSAFAIGSLTTEEELFVQKYKVLSIYSETAKRFVPLLKKYGMEPTGHLVTAWDTFSEEKPGAAERLEIAGQTVPDMIKELCKIGMYKG